MGLRFRKSFKVLPGVKINVSPSGFSTSIGGKGLIYNINHRGRRKKVDPNEPSNYSNKGCLLFFGIPLVLILVFIVWVLSLGGGFTPYKHPVLVKGEGVNVRKYDNTESYSTILGSVSTGDTLELHAIQENGWCRVSTHDAKSPFDKELHVYIQRKFLIIPDSTIAAAQKGDMY